MFGVGGGAEWTPLMGTSFAVGIRNRGSFAMSTAHCVWVTLTVPVVFDAFGLGEEGHAEAVTVPLGTILFIN